jgi:DNA modification methylase
MTIQVMEGDCRSVLPELASDSIDCIVTSPPYFGLKDYGVDGQIGLEPTPDDYTAALVSVFRESRRLLKKDGTFWLNLGDSYAGYHGNKNSLSPSSATNGWTNGTNENKRGDRRPQDIGLKQKDLIGIPWRVAMALQSDGWYLRQDIIWHKPNPAPESVSDRATKSHEYVFMLSKSPRYFYDMGAAVEASVGGGTRNRRSVWNIPITPSRGPHFAAMPIELARMCIEAGCRPGGTVLDPFGGSGTTAEAARLLNRNAILVESNKEYADFSRDRFLS